MIRVTRLLAMSPQVMLRAAMQTKLTLKKQPTSTMSCSIQKSVPMDPAAVF